MSALLIVVFLHIGYAAPPVTIMLDMPSLKQCEEVKEKIIIDLTGKFSRLNLVRAEGTCIKK